MKYYVVSQKTVSMDVKNNHNVIRYERDIETENNSQTWPGSELAIRDLAMH